MRKPAFTLIESMVSLLIISAVSMVAMTFSSAYLKTGYDRDVRMSAVTNNINAVEKLRAEVTTLPQLYEFSKDKDIKMSAVGLGEIELQEDGSFTVKEYENNNFSEKVKPKKANLFKIEVGGNIPNTKIITVVILK